MSRSFLSLFILLVFACGKDNNSRSLVGKWVSVEKFADSALGGCSCWSIVLPAEEYTIEFRVNGTYSYRPPMFSAFSGCSGDFYKSSDSTISWNWCGQQRVDRFYFDNTFLIIERDLPVGHLKNRYRRVPF